MTSKLVVNTIEADTGISSVSFASSISMSSTSKFHFSNAGIDIGADTNINRPAAGVLGFNINSAEKFRIDSSGHIKAVGVCTATHFYGDGSNLTGISGVSVANQADNRLITATGTTDALNAESSLTYDGTKVLNITSSAGGFFQGTDSDGGIGLLEMGNGDVAIQADTGNSINNSKIHFFLYGSEKLRITSAGRLGIGEDNPDSLLHLKAGNDRSSIRLENTYDTPDNVWEIQPGISGVSNTGFCIRDITDSANRFVINGSGNIGFNDNSPANFTGYTNLSIHGSPGGAITFGDDGTDEWEIYAGDGVVKIFDRANTQERIRISDNGAIGLGGANYGSSGQVLTSQGSGSAVTWTTVTGTTINNNADNRVITGSGTANTLNGEANLTFNGSTFQVSGEGYVTGNLSIGEPSPDRKLHVKSGANNNNGAFRVESAPGNIMDMGTDSSMHFLNCVSADPFRIKVAGNEALRLTHETSGNGTTTLQFFMVTNNIQVATPYI